MLDEITPVILTLNESANIGRALKRLSWAREVIIVDSYSIDDTESIVKSFPNTRFVQRRFDTHANQWNFGIKETNIRTEWVLALDADFLVDEAFLAEVAALSPAAETSAYIACFDYAVWGTVLPGSAYPPLKVLFRNKTSHYVQDGHTQRLTTYGNALTLKSRIVHDDRKSMARWLDSQRNYITLELTKITTVAGHSLSWPDRLRKLIVIAPPLMFVYCYVLKGGWRRGWKGLLYSVQRMAVELLLSLYLIERKLIATSDERDGR